MAKATLIREPYVPHDGQWEHLPTRHQAKAGKPELTACPHCGARWETDDLKFERLDCINCGNSVKKNDYWLAIRDTIDTTAEVIR